MNKDSIYSNQHPSLINMTPSLSPKMSQVPSPKMSPMISPKISYDMLSTRSPIPGIMPHVMSPEISPVFPPKVLPVVKPKDNLSKTLINNNNSSHILIPHDEIDTDETENFDIKNNSDEYIFNNGLTENEFQTCDSSKTINLNQCMYCTKYYPQELVIIYNSDNVCYHCLFYINYDISTRDSVDGVYGLTISEYVINYRNTHDINNCPRDGVGCFLCDNLHGIIIEGIIGGEMINNAINNDIIKENNNHDEFMIKVSV